MKIKGWIENLPEYIPGRTINEIKEKYKLENVYKLASNENILGPAPGVKERICDAAKNVNYYPDSNCTKIREKLSQKYGLSTDNIIMGNGTDQIIEMVCNCLIAETENILISDPTFLIYEKATLKLGGKAIKVPLKDYRQDVRSLVSRINKNTRIIFLTSPHNPTGTNITRDEFEYVLSESGKDILVVIDEAYYEYVGDSEKINTVSYLKNFPNLLILRTFSKIYGLAGLRIGYGISNSHVIRALNKTRLPFNVNSIAQEAAIEALENSLYIKKVRDEVNREKEKFYRAFNENGINYLKSYANFILIETGKDDKEVAEELLKVGFIVRPGSNLGLPGFIRVTVSLPEINDKFINTFIRIIKK
ncbi:MAG: histidinol-phosphate transaminase [Actinomycetota bacterium]